MSKTRQGKDWNILLKSFLATEIKVSFASYAAPPTLPPAMTQSARAGMGRGREVGSSRRPSPRVTCSAQLPEGKQSGPAPGIYYCQRERGGGALDSGASP